MKRTVRTNVTKEPASGSIIAVYAVSGLWAGYVDTAPNNPTNEAPTSGPIADKYVSSACSPDTKKKYKKTTQAGRQAGRPAGVIWRGARCEGREAMTKSKHGPPEPQPSNNHTIQNDPTICSQLQPLHPTRSYRATRIAGCIRFPVVVICLRDEKRTRGGFIGVT